MQSRDSNGRYTSKRKAWLRILVALWALVGVFATINLGLEWYQDKFVPEPTEVISPIVEEVELSEREKILSELDGIERQICEKFPILECKVALAVSEAENSGRDPEALNYNTNGSFDVGIFQINSVHWNSDYCPGLSELAQTEANIDCAVQVWDRCDGTEGDNKGSFACWTQFSNGVFAQNL